MPVCRLSLVLAIVLGIAATSNGQSPIDPADWPMYNRDVLGTRFNPAEKSLSAANAGKIEEKWRFPRQGEPEIGVIHATPAVVNGQVYFGTATDAAFYKLSPEGKVCWSYRNPAHKPNGLSAMLGGPKARFQNGTGGIMCSALVDGNAVYFADNAGWIYAVDRMSGKEIWKRATTAPEWPDAHPLNLIMASPIMAGDKLIICGGSIEQVVVGVVPFYRGSTGRGFVAALEPKTGKLIWKFDLGPKPEKFDPPMVIKDSWGSHTFHFGPATSSIWSTPSFDASTQTIYFGTDVNTAPRKPTPDNPSLSTPESCAVIALDTTNGKPRWVRQINPDDVWTNGMRSYDPEKKRYKDQSIGDTPKIYEIDSQGKKLKVVGVGCKNGGFYVIDAKTGEIVAQTPIYTGPPTFPLNPAPSPRMIALPSCIGGVQTGCATDGKTIYTNGIDALRMMSSEKVIDASSPPTAGRVVAISTDTKDERWRHERPVVAELGGPAPRPMYKNIGDPVASGIALANGLVAFTAVTSGTLNILDAQNGRPLKQFIIGPVWAGPSISRGRIYVGSGNTLFTPADADAYFPKRATGTLFCYGLPGADAVSGIAEEPK